MDEDHRKSNLSDKARKDTEGGLEGDK